MSIQYTVPGLELTTFREHESPSTTARPGLEFLSVRNNANGSAFGAPANYKT